MPKHHDIADYDITIVGGGLVGASLAIALAPTGLNIAVIEAFPVDTDAQPSYDERTIALTYRSKQIFDALAVWQGAVAQASNPIEHIHISNRGHSGITRLSCEDIGTPALGHVTPTRVLGIALHARMQQFDNIDLRCPAQAQTLEKTDQGYRLDISEAGHSCPLNTRLLVVADGGRSPLIQLLGVTTQNENYPQSALLSIVSTDRPHQNRAYERFTASGPLALLPMTQQRYAVVWTLHPDELAETQALDDASFLHALQTAFGYRAGNFSQPTPHKAYPLSKTILDNPIRENAVIIGNAAHKIHPVAGQGFNLGLRDVAALAATIGDAIKHQKEFASTALLQSYQRARAQETQRVMRFTDGLIQLFSNELAPLAAARNLGLAAVQHCPPAKRFLLRRTMGLASPAFRLPE